jgi:hypothetical protein
MADPLFNSCSKRAIGALPKTSPSWSFLLNQFGLAAMKKVRRKLLLMRMGKTSSPK